MEARLRGRGLFVRSRMLEVREKVLKFAHEMINAESGEVAATRELTCCRDSRRGRLRRRDCSQIAAAAVGMRSNGRQMVGHVAASATEYAGR